MPKKSYSVTRYRDSRTGRLVSEATYKRSKAHHGSHIKKEVATYFENSPRTLPSPRKRKREVEERIDQGDETDHDEDYEYEGAFDSPGKGKK